MINVLLHSFNLYVIAEITRKRRMPVGVIGLVASEPGEQQRAFFQRVKVDAIDA